MKELDIKRALKEHNITQAELCRRTGILTQNMRTIINGNPTVEKLKLVATGIGCDITDLFYPSEESSSSEAENINQEVAAPSFASPAPSTPATPQQGDTSAPADLFTPQTAAEVTEHTVHVPQPEQAMQTIAFCPHCGAKVRVGVVLLPE